MTKRQVQSEIYIRQKVLEAMVKNSIRDNKQVCDVFQDYHNNPKAVISRFNLQKEIETEIKKAMNS